MMKQVLALIGLAVCLGIGIGIIVVVVNICYCYYILGLQVRFCLDYVFSSTYCIKNLLDEEVSLHIHTGYLVKILKMQFF